MPIGHHPILLTNPFEMLPEFSLEFALVVCSILQLNRKSEDDMMLTPYV